MRTILLVLAASSTKSIGSRQRTSFTASAMRFLRELRFAESAKFRRGDSRRSSLRLRNKLEQTGWQSKQMDVIVKAG
jgi:hypothetical protein